MTDANLRGADRVDQELAAIVAGRPELTVLDVGGGSGTRSVPLAGLGCQVTVVDSSADALAILRRRAAEAGVSERVRGIQADAENFADAVPGRSVDLVLCHHVLESVDDPAAVLRALAAALRTGGTLSLLASGRYFPLLAQALAGRFVEAAVLLADPQGRYGDEDPLRHRFDVEEVTVLLVEAGLTVESVAGLGVVAGLISGAARRSQPHGADQLVSLEAALAVHPVLREIAADLHVLARLDPAPVPPG